ncbi:hypothetical protein K435DRAFT_780267 [Dendrothele bispora CBS 962.96]|uniref:Polysaccharide lyase 14 domain-containing protein n=1 Tax=Dendrothele bispora (strain CBS 962.96) TaxID=1314807 RepID=A0A4S8LSU4_DENBC|nr:hypothetical protein K435DRAFT_780267 [Dendrothele bispora CBS 962.96]
MLFPVPDFSKSWTTCSDSSDALPLDDETLVVSTDKKDLPHNYGTFEGKNTMKAVFPKGSYIPSKDPPGGLSFYASGPEEVDLTTAKEATFGYSVFFPDDFEYVKGGKLPGLWWIQKVKGSTGIRRIEQKFGEHWMDSDEGRIRGIIMQTFLEVSCSPDYASPKDQSIYFGDFSMAITEEL